MIIISILSIIVAISLQHVNNPLASQATRDPISPILFARITSIFFIYSAILNSHVLYIDNIESGIGIYNGYYQVTSISLSIEIFMYLIGALILMPWYPSVYSRKETFSSSPEMSEGRGELVGIGEVVSSPSRRDHTAKWEATTLFNSESLKVSDTTSRLPMTEIDYKSSSPLTRTLTRTMTISQPVDFSAEYSLILLFTILGGSLLISSSDLISMYLSIELQSFAVYILTSLNRNSETSTSAGLKYFLLGGLSSCLILLGCALVYSYTGITNLDSIYSLVSVPSVWLPELSLGIDPLTNVSGGRGFLLGIVLIVIGFLFKIAGAPFHNWAPDVYDDSSTIVTTWLTIMPKISIIIFLLELESGLFLPLSGSLGGPSMYMSEYDMTSLFQIVKEIYEVYPLQLTSPLNVNVIKSLLLFSSLLSLIIGTVVGLAQYKIKRLLAYSTISHVGFLLLALGINTEQSIESLIFYILQYSITNLNTFLILLVFGYTFNTFLLDQSNTNHLALSPLAALWSNKEQHSFSRSDKWNQKSKSNSLPVHRSEGFEESHTIQSNSMDIKYISQLKAQFIYNPILSLSLAICLFSMAGI